MPNTQELISRAESALAGITPGEWQYKLRKKYGPNVFVQMDSGMNIYLFEDQCDWGEKTAEFIASAPSLVRELVAEVKRLEVEQAASSSRCTGGCMIDKITRARLRTLSERYNSESVFEVLNVSTMEAMELIDAIPELLGALEDAEARAVEAGRQRDKALMFIIEEYDTDPPCVRNVNGECLISESTGLECDSNEGPRNLDYLPCWQAWAKQQP